MVKIKDIINSLRPYQWYKNLVIFLAIIFSKHFLIIDDWIYSIIGFAALCLISSAGYLLNDIIDQKLDSKNQEKRFRPIASGKVSVAFAAILAVILLFIGMLIAYQLNPIFSAIGGILFMLSLAYSLYIKNILFADIIVIAFNFVLRAISGAIILSVYISPWLVIGVFFFGLYLVTGKRYSEVYYLKGTSSAHRPVLSMYSKEILTSLFSLFLAVLIVTFSLFSFLSGHNNLLWTTPIFLYLLLRYYYLITSGNRIARNPEEITKDMPLLIGSLLFIILAVIIISL
jgi:4-hydroxybenzoate polyprenyltransferase